MCVACGHHTGTVHAQVTTHFELHLTTGANFAEGWQCGIGHQLALDGQVTARQNQCVIASRDASRQQRIALAQDVDMAGRDAVSAKRTRTLDCAVLVQPLGNRLGAVLGRRHILVERDLGQRGHLGLDLVGSELDLVGKEVGDVAGPVVVQGGPRIGHRRVGAGPVVAINIVGLVGVPRVGGTGARVETLGCCTGEAAHIAHLADRSCSRDKARRRNVARAAQSVSGVGALQRPGWRIGQCGGQGRGVVVQHVLALAGGALIGHTEPFGRIVQVPVTGGIELVMTGRAVAVIVGTQKVGTRIAGCEAKQRIKPCA